MHSRIMPCARDSLPRFSAGRVMIIMTASMTGISSTRLELMPNRVELCGTVKGASVTDIPLTSTRLNTFAPTMLPRDRSLQPLTNEVMAVTSSGREVPSATKVSAMTDSGTPSACAMRVPLSTSRFAPSAISTAPSTSSTSVLVRDISSPAFSASASASAAAGAFFICNTFATM